MDEEPEIAVVGTKGLIVIPLRLRNELKIKPKTKLALYRKGDKIVVTRLEIPTLTEDLQKFFNEVDESRAGLKQPARGEILQEIKKLRTEKQRKGA